MRIETIQLYRVPLGSVDPSGATSLPAELVVARLQSGAHVGWGDVALRTAPRECDEWSAGAFACLRDWLAPAIVGQAIASGDALQELLSPFQGNRAAKSALDVAWWNLSAAARSQPLHRLLGAEDGAVGIGRSLGVADSPETLFAEIRAALSAGCDHVLLKLSPGRDVEMLRAVRQAFPAEPIAVDCDGACSLSQQEMFYRMEDFFLKYIEQPFDADDLVAHAMLQENLRTPVSLDQSITTLARAEQALDLGCCQAMRIQLARVGGLTPAVAIHQACAASNVRCTVSGAALGPASFPVAAALAAHCGGALEQVPGTAHLFAGKHELPLAADACNQPVDESALASQAIEQTTLE